MYVNDRFYTNPTPARAIVKHIVVRDCCIPFLHTRQPDVCVVLPACLQRLKAVRLQEFYKLVLDRLGWLCARAAKKKVASEHFLLPIVEYQFEYMTAPA